MLIFEKLIPVRPNISPCRVHVSSPYSGISVAAMLEALSLDN